jgi:S-adenosylmethionine:tRNA ribosyltransferase-isomerase
MIPTWTPDDFDYDLPPDRIAQTAVEPRDSARMLVIHRANSRLAHRTFRDLPEYLRPGDVLVLNETRVIPARLHARKIPSGGAVEVLLLEPLDSARWLTLVGGKRLRPGTRLSIQAHGDVPPLEAVIEAESTESQRIVAFNRPVEPYLEAIGEAPLPPYIHTPLADPERYQTVYARTPGSVAAPTAGLHFTPDLLLQVRAMGVGLVYCTLHVGPGTFMPVRAEHIAARRLHAERAELTPDAARAINEARLRGGRIVAVGTTTVRTLETAALHAAGADLCGDVESGSPQEGEACPWRPLSAFAGQTDLFIMPGFRFRAVDVMITNFHLPRSSLLMLVSAFAGRDLMLQAYEVAKAEGYRFYSLGDACLILD